MDISEQEKNRIRGLHKNNSIIKEQVTIQDGQVMLDPRLDVDSQIKQVMDNINGNIISELSLLMNEVDVSAGVDGELMGAHEIKDRLMQIVYKIGRNEYLTI